MIWGNVPPRSVINFGARVIPRNRVHRITEGSSGAAVFTAKGQEIRFLLQPTGGLGKNWVQNPGLSSPDVTDDLRSWVATSDHPVDIHGLLLAFEGQGSPVFYKKLILDMNEGFVGDQDATNTRLAVFLTAF